MKKKAGEEHLRQAREETHLQEDCDENGDSPAGKEDENWKPDIPTNPEIWSIFATAQGSCFTKASVEYKFNISTEVQEIREESGL